MADREQGFKSDLVIQFVLSSRGTQGHQKIDKRIIKNSFKPKKLQTEIFIA